VRFGDLAACSPYLSSGYTISIFEFEFPTRTGPVGRRRSVRDCQGGTGAVVKRAARNRVFQYAYCHSTIGLAMVPFARSEEAMLSVDTITPMVNARPVHHVSDDTIWGEAALLRNASYESIKRALADRQIDALVTKAPNGIYPTWVKVEAWLPEKPANNPSTDRRLRTSLELRFEVKPYREQSVTTSAVAQIGRRSIAIADRPAFTADDAAEWALYAVGKARKPRQASISDVAANAVLSLVPFARTRYSNKISSAFRRPIPVTLPRVLVFAGLACIVIGLGIQGGINDDLDPVAATTFAIGPAMFLIALAICRRRNVIVSVIDRPTIPPRYLLRLDSWHAIIPDLGSQVEEVKRRIVKKLEPLVPSGITTVTERYGFRSPNGYDERDRLVITKGQGVAHLHLYRFGADIFVGWDSYINWAQWTETRPISARVSAGEVTEYRGLEPGVYIPNEYDLIDLNSLIEAVHRCVTVVLKATMEEHKIDQEIDFTIIRGDRDLALDKDRYDRRQKQVDDGSSVHARRGWRVT
jgi:hypothetical protein